MSPILGVFIYPKHSECVAHEVKCHRVNVLLVKGPGCNRKGGFPVNLWRVSPILGGFIYPLHSERVAHEVKCRGVNILLVKGPMSEAERM